MAVLLCAILENCGGPQLNHATRLKTDAPLSNLVSYEIYFTTHFRGSAASGACRRVTIAGIGLRQDNAWPWPTHSYLEQN